MEEYCLKDLLDKPNDYMDFLRIHGFLIYRIRNMDNNKSYIGSTKEDLYFRLFSNVRGHLIQYKDENRKSKLYKAMRSEGLSKFYISILSTDATETEEQYITKFDSYKDGYNCTSDGLSWADTEGDSPLLGKIKVYKDNTLIHILPNELDQYLLDGWKKGDCFVGKGSRNTVFVTKGDITKRIPKSDLEYYLDQGWVNHRTLWDNKKLYYHRGEEVKIIYPDEVPHYESLGFVRGRPHRNYITDGKSSKIVSDNDLQSYLDKGWYIGKHYSSTGGKTRTIVNGITKYI